MRDARERESLNSSIQSSFAPRKPAQFDLPEHGNGTENRDREQHGAESSTAVVPQGNARYVFFSLCVGRGNVLMLMAKTNAE